MIEVLSTNRTDDLVRKSTEYLAAGARQYWIVAPRDRVVEVFELSGSGMGADCPVKLSDDALEATVKVPSYGVIEVTLACILG